MQICVNVRALRAPLTGVQRYMAELLARFGDTIEHLEPAQPRLGMSGHAWEQFVLPARVGGRLLWSPANCGPLALRHQVVTIHDLSPIEHPEWSAPKFAAWYQFLLPKLAQRAARLITVSEYTRQRVIERFRIPEHKVTAIALGVDPRFHTQSAVTIMQMRRTLSIPSERYFVAMGSREPRKNLKRLLAAWDQIHARLPDVCLVLAGEMGRADLFRSSALHWLPPRVHLTGRVPDSLLPALYAGALAAPYLSVYEGFGLPLLEAMACGTPVISGNCTSLPEVIGDAGILLDPYNVEAIADSLLLLAGNDMLRQILRTKGLQRTKHFTWDATAERTLQILQRGTMG
jgi:glycosyltransferase involved in cell wall biosynthesis